MIKLLNGDLYSYSRLRFTGLNTQDILNIASKNGIIIKNAVRTEYAVMEADVYRVHIKKLKKLLGKSKYKITTVKRSGLSYKITANKKRVFLWLGMFLAFVGLALVLSRTWQVKVIGYDQPKKIIEIVKSNNMLTWKIGLNDKIEGLQQQISQSDQNILWNSVSINGTVIEVYIKENTNLLPKEDNTGNVYADKDCVIRNLIVLGGTGKVANGTTVSKGDMLIEATQKIGEEYYPVTAKGKAIASVYYSGSETVPLKNTVYNETGNKKTVCSIRFLGMNILAGGQNEFTNSNMVTEEIRTFGLPIKITKTTYYETMPSVTETNKEQAIKETETFLISKLKQQIPENAEIYKTETTVTESDDSLTVQVYIETVEDVAVRG